MKSHLQDSSLKDLTSEELNKILEMWTDYPWENKDAYVEFISNMYYVLSQSCRLLAAAAARCDLDMDVFHHRFIEHAHEEKNHEKLITHDLKALGEQLAPGLPSITPFWQCQFYMVEHISPLSLFGYILYLENLSLFDGNARRAYQRCVKAHGPKATTYLRIHIEEDVDHVDKLFDYLGKLPKNEVNKVRESLLISSSLYKNFFSELYLKHSGRSMNKILKAG